jgi:hypothetical protein
MKKISGFQERCQSSGGLREMTRPQLRTLQPSPVITA